MKTKLAVLILFCASLNVSAQKTIQTGDKIIIIDNNGDTTLYQTRDTIIIKGKNGKLVQTQDKIIRIDSNGDTALYQTPDIIIQKNKDKVISIGTIDSTAFKQNDTTEVSVLGKKILVINDGDNKVHIMFGKDTEAETDNDSTKTKEPKNVHLKPFAMDLGFNTYLYEGDFSLPKKYYMLRADVFKSRNVNLHFLVTKINLYQHHWHFVTSLDMIYNNFAMEEKSTLIPRSDSIVAFIDTTVNFTKDKLLARYFSVPFMLEYQSKADKRKGSFRMAAGFEIGLRSKSLTKQISNENGRVKFTDDYNLEDIQYGITARIGYGWIDFYANYSLSNLFKKAEGPELHTLSAGISLIGF